jgi:hypothetical protein
MNRFGCGIAMIVTFMVLLLTGIGALGGYTSGIYTRGDDTVHRGWDGAWRVGLEFGGITLGLIIASGIVVSILMWMRGDR